MWKLELWQILYNFLACVIPAAMTSAGHRNENGSSHDSKLQNDEASSGRAVLVACIAITFITGMTLRPLGFYFVNFISHFESAREPVAWAVSLTSASVLFAGEQSVIFVENGNYAKLANIFTTSGCLATTITLYILLYRLIWFYPICIYLLIWWQLKESAFFGLVSASFDEMQRRGSR